MSQPPKSTIRAPEAMCSSASGVRLRVADMRGNSGAAALPGLRKAASGHASTARLNLPPLCPLPESCPRVCTFGAWAARYVPIRDGLKGAAPGLSRVLFCRVDRNRDRGKHGRYGLPERFRANCAFGGGQLDGRSLNMRDSGASIHRNPGRRKARKPGSPRAVRAAATDREQAAATNPARCPAASSARSPASARRWHGPRVPCGAIRE